MVDIIRNYYRLSYQWVCLELGEYQIYELSVMFDHSVIAVKIIPDPNLSPEVKEKSFSDSNELVRSVQGFINDLMKEHMTATFAKSPVVCYTPCSQCKKMHLSVEKATKKSSVYCPVSQVHADITDYHNILSGLQLYTTLYIATMCYCVVHLSNKSEIYSTSDSSQIKLDSDHSKGLFKCLVNMTSSQTCNQLFYITPTVSMYHHLH